MATNEKFDIYHIIKNITYEKDKDLPNHPEFKKTYNQYSINYFLMAHPHTCHLVMFASSAKMTDAQHYLFLMYCTEKKYIFFKREYKEKANKEEDLKIDCIAKYFYINKTHAKDLIKILKPTKVAEIVGFYSTETINKGKKYARI